jgi:hypothetical protein
MLKKKIYNSYIKELTYIFFLAFFLFIGKWFFSFYYFNEDLGIKIILESQSDGYFYFPYVKAFSTLNFNNSFDLNITNLKNISLPFGSIFFHSIFFYFFGISSFVILELLCIFLFLIIFYLIFLKFQLSKPISIILALFLFILPSLVHWLKLDQISYLSKLSDLYDLRFPRSLVVNLFLFYFILFLLNLNNKKNYSNKDFIILGFILAASFTSFYYFFIIEFISLLLFLFYKSSFSISNFFDKKIKFYLILIFTFFILSAPFLLNMYFSEPDYNERLCIIDLNLNRKIILLNHLLKGILKIEFLFVFFVISFSTYWFNKKKIQNFHLNNIFYIFFISSVLSPFIFIIFSPKSCLVYHFNNSIFIFSFLSFLFIFINILKNIFNNYFIIKSINQSLLVFFIFIFIIFYNLKIFFDYRSNYNLKDYTDYRNYLNLTVLEIQKVKSLDKNLSLLTFDPHLMVWAIMNDIKNIKPISGQLVPKTHDMIESDLISTFKFLDLNENDFIKLFENKKSGWRYLNSYTQIFFWMKYSANSLKTFNDSKEFDSDVMKFIENTSPLHAQSLAIPNDEYKRLRFKFKNFKENQYKKPSIVAVGRTNILSSNPKIIEVYYCSIKTTDELVIYKLKKDILINCN